MGNQISSEKIKQINTLEAIEYKPPIEMPADEIEVVDEKIIKDEDIGQTALF
jgi:topoisomerase-4 subunit A